MMIFYAWDIGFILNHIISLGLGRKPNEEEEVDIDWWYIQQL